MPDSLSERNGVSVVVASVRDAHHLEACLQSLVPQAAVHSAEIIVARALVGADRIPEENWPGVTFVLVDGPPNIPKVRGAGLARSRGARVVLTEDHCVASPHWLSSLLSVSTDVSVVGGSVDTTQRHRGVDLAAWFAEYGFFSPHAGQDPLLITGANVLYGADVVDNAALWMQEGVWENVVHDRLRDRGVTFVRIPDAVVSQTLHYGVTAFCRDRYAHGKSYAAARIGEHGVGKRVLMAAGSIVLPGVLLLRVARRAGLGAPVDFLRALPWIVVFLMAWSVGECAGYVGGVGADAR